MSDEGRTPEASVKDEKRMPGMSAGESGHTPGISDGKSEQMSVTSGLDPEYTCKTDILSLTRSELESRMEQEGQKRFRAGQIYEWLHVRHVRTFDEMTNLPKALRCGLDEGYRIMSLEPRQVLTSRIDGTKKYLFALEDGNVIESVLMRYAYGLSACISSQVGCSMGCRFCASTIGGKIRSLRASEMLLQVTEMSRDAGERIGHVVIMGSGEPMDNYENLVRFLKIMGDPKGECLSLRDITVSTCGIVPGIYRLASEHLPVTLALSLHAPCQEKRERLMPIARKYPLGEVIDAVRAYFEKTGRRITFEYSCVEGENTSPDDARMLADLVSGMNCHINLIPVNPVTERSFRRPNRAKIEAFRGMLEKRGISVTIRREMGRDINGACGQLRRSYLSPEE